MTAEPLCAWPGCGRVKSFHFLHDHRFLSPDSMPRDRMAAMERRVEEIKLRYWATQGAKIAALETKLAEVEKRVGEISSDPRREAKRLNALEAKAAPETLHAECGYPWRFHYESVEINTGERHVMCPPHVVPPVLRPDRDNVHERILEILGRYDSKKVSRSQTIGELIVLLAPPASVAPAQDNDGCQGMCGEVRCGSVLPCSVHGNRLPPKRDDGPGERCARDGCGHSSRLHNPNCVGFHTWPDGGKNPVCQCHCHTFVPSALEAPAPEPPAPTPSEPKDRIVLAYLPTMGAAGGWIRCHAPDKCDHNRHDYIERRALAAEPKETER